VAELQGIPARDAQSENFTLGIPHGLGKTEQYLQAIDFMTVFEAGTAIASLLCELPENSLLQGTFR
jgi:hypothetical protein